MPVSICRLHTFHHPTLTCKQMFTLLYTDIWLKLPEFHKYQEVKLHKFSYGKVKNNWWLYFRFDMSKPENYYGQKPMARTLTEIKKCALEQKLSCVHQPLIEIQLENIILDELHLMLRITGEINILHCMIWTIYMNFSYRLKYSLKKDTPYPRTWYFNMYISHIKLSRWNIFETIIQIIPFCVHTGTIDVLTKNLVSAAINWDKVGNMNKCPCERRTAHLDALIGAINNRRVCFQVWEKKDTDGKRSGTYDFTSLMGNDKKLLLEHLHEKLPGVIKSDASASVIKIWKVLCSKTCFTWYKDRIESLHLSVYIYLVYVHY